jgi:hypothetical protein
MGNAGFRQRWKMVKVACISQACSFVVEWSWMLSFANVRGKGRCHQGMRGKGRGGFGFSEG